MQIYTKILIGMGVGVVLGLTVGPTSSLLKHDLYRISNPLKASLYAATSEGPGAEISLKALGKHAPELELLELEARTQKLVDTQGVEHEVTGMILGTLEYSEQLSLRDPGGKIAKSLGVSKVGDVARVWLKIEHQPLESGGFAPSITPISALGDTIISCVSPIGDLFMRLIKMVIVPLVFASLLVGIAGLGDLRKLGRMGGKTLLLYITTTALAVTIGLICAHALQPGDYIEEKDRARLQAQYTGAASDKVDKAAEAPSAIDNVLGIIPENPVASLSQGNMLQIIFFAVVFGIALTMLGASEAQVVVTFFDKVQQAMVMIIHMVMLIAPFGVAALIAEVIGSSGWSVLKALMVYSVTVLIGLFLQAALVYGSIVKAWAKVPIGSFLRSIRPAQLLAFSTSSSSATLPVSMECAEKSLGVSNSVSSFVLPLGSTVNMDGTALYQGVAAIFIAQVFNVDLTLGDQLGIVLTATMASVGAAGVPGAGMITLAMVLTAAGIPTVGVALILGMDRLLDMFRTAVNVTGDLAVTCAMAASEGETIDPLEPGEDTGDPESGFEGRLDRDPQPIDPD